MNFQRKSEARCSWLISAWDKEHKGNRMRYDKFETAFLVFLTELDWKSVAGSRLRATNPKQRNSG
jgi:hypothetical protein